jgi:hypothetical protein
VRFWAFLGKGSSKTPKQCSYKKSMSKLFTKKIDKTFDVSFLRLLCSIAFSGVSQRWEFKGTAKNVLQKNLVEKFLEKNRQKNRHYFFLDLFLLI